MGNIRGNPWFGIWEDNEEKDGCYSKYAPKPHQALDKAREEEFKERHKSGGVITYYVDPELLKQGIFKKIEK